ncbi:rho family-interacting cell polarization regulator 1 [Aplochiton taeniatus]
MYSGYGGSPSRAVSTMSLSVRPSRRLTSRSITRSQSFAGVNSYDKSYRKLSVFSTPGLHRKTSRASRMFNMSAKSPPPKLPQPERLDDVYKALKKGLQSYLQVHQMELDGLSRQMRESKRNSRLGFLYELDKQVKVTERFMRRLEFHLSKIEELYEAYCMQRRLRDGADKMVKAYTASSSSKEARESLSEANKGYREYTENMCVLESDLENQLGEFHIKMKGLAGFARLCAGDQYEIFMKYGRQRLKMRGRIEMNGKQVWDTEDMVFQPLITEFLSIKVTELKGITNHVVVGTVSCETKDLFTALPQAVAVDINDLGTIKLSLEVTWNPFDKDDQASTASTVNKAASVSKRFSTYLPNQSPPDTPSLREQAFYNMLRRSEEVENGTAWSNSSESSDDSSSPQLSLGGLRSSSQHHKPSVTPDLQSAATTNSTPSQSGDGSEPAGEDCGKDVDEAGRAGVPEDGGKAGILNGHGSGRYSRSLSHISEGSADGILLTDRPAGDSLAPPEETSQGSCLSVTDVQMDVGAEPETPAAEAATPAAEAAEPVPAATPPPGEGSVEEALAAVVSSLDDYRGQFPELQLLEQELQLLQDTLTSRSASRSSSVSLAVETALGSFDFLNTSDLDEEEEEEEEEETKEEEDGAGEGQKRSRTYSTQRRASGKPSGESVEKEAGCEEPEWDSPSSEPLTTSCPALDHTLLVHLRNCTSQLLRLGTFGPLRCGEMYALDRLLREARVLEVIRRITKETPGKFTQPDEVVPQLEQCHGASSLWQQSTENDSVYSTSTDAFLVATATAYTCKLPERATAMADTVFLRLVEKILERRLPRRGRATSETLTLFQFWCYLEAEGVSELDTHVTELAEEVWLVQSLQSEDQDTLVRALRRPPESSLKRDGLHAVARLLRDPRGKVSASASSLLRSLADQPRHRERALVSCLELLEEENLETRVCGCKALACLKAKESIDQLVYLCRTDKEEVREAAKQALLVLGEEGKMAHRHVESSQDGLPRLFAPGRMASTAF